MCLFINRFYRYIVSRYELISERHVIENASELGRNVHLNEAIYSAANKSKNYSHE